MYDYITYWYVYDRCANMKAEQWPTIIIHILTPGTVNINRLHGKGELRL